VKADRRDVEKLSERPGRFTIVRINCKQGNKLMAYPQTVIGQFPFNTEAERVVLEQLVPQCDEPKQTRRLDFD
jgi:hypothetical protein